MFDDNDMKIAGSRPSLSVGQAIENDSVRGEIDRAKSLGEFDKARQLGEQMAEMLLRDNGLISFGITDDSEDISRRRELFAFTVTVGFEVSLISSVVAAAAYGAFFDRLKTLSKEIYFELSDAGAFSFYYLAYRRGGEVDRRMGQTYAMLCEKDGDPVFQELGEALFCYFSAAVKEAAQELGIGK